MEVLGMGTGEDRSILLVLSPTRGLPDGSSRRPLNPEAQADFTGS
jgi:hypothetical protein